MRSAVTFSILSYWPGYWPIDLQIWFSFREWMDESRCYPMATPSPPWNTESWMRILVEFAFREILSSPPVTVQLRNVIRFEKNVSTPSVFRAGACHKISFSAYIQYMEENMGTELDDVELMYMPSKRTSSESLIAMVQNWDWTKRIPENKDFVVLLIIRLMGRPGKLETPWVKSYLSR